MSTKNNFFKSFTYAGNGVKEAIKNEPNLRFHLIMATLVIIIAALLHFSPEKFAILIVTIFLVISLELINTIVEETVNIISPDYSVKAKLIKDLAAATVLLAAFASVLIGLLLFLPSILPLLSF